MKYVGIGEDLLLSEAMKLAKWWIRCKGKSVTVTKSPKRSCRGSIVYDVYLLKKGNTYVCYKAPR